MDINKYVSKYTGAEVDAAIEKALNLPEQGQTATPDLSQNDPTAADYIKNRPFYKESERTVVYEGIVNGGGGYSTIVNNGETIKTYLFYDVFYDSSNYSYIRGIKDNETYIVTFDGTEYILNSHRVDSYNSFYIGNERMVSYIGTQNSDVPFALTTSYNDDDSISTVTLHMLDSNSHTIKIIFEDVTYNKLAIEYIPDEVRSNWEQNDPSAINYIENRPFYQAGRIGKTEIKETTVNTAWIDENSLWQAEVPYAGFFSSSDLRASMYEVVIDGIKYIVPYTQVYSTAGYLGVEDINNSQEYPFSFWTVNGYGGTVVWRLNFATEGPHTVKVTQLIGYSIVQLDEKFIPDTIARTSDVENLHNIIPPITPEDEGKVLRVVNGVATWVAD